MPGEDFAETMRVVAGATPDLIALPELPDRGPHAGMTGRGVALLVGMGADVQPAGWRLTGGGTSTGGVDHRRAVSLLAQDLDAFEEQLDGYDGQIKVQVPGPLTFAATIERPRGDRLVADHGARRELAQSLAEGVRLHVADVRKRVPGAQVTVQVDEPALTAVLGGDIPTASGWGNHRVVHPPEASESLGWLVEAAVDAGARPVVHCCAAEVPVALLAGAGFQAIGFDLGLATTSDAWGEAYESGVDLWPGVVPTIEGEPLSDKRMVGAVQRFFGELGYDHSSYAHRLVLTPTCGLAGATPPLARQALRTVTRLAASTS